MTAYTITRTRDDGHAITWDGRKLRECGQLVAFCAADNLGMTRQDATRAGMSAEAAFKAGEGYGLGRYTFTTEVSA